MTNIIVVLFLVFRTLTSAGGRHIKLKRLYFLWVCKHIESFQWFVDLLHSLHNEVRFYWPSLGDIYVIHQLLFTGRFVLGEFWVPPEGTVSPNTDWPRPVNDIFIFFHLRFKSFRKTLLQPLTYVCWSRTRSSWWSARSIANQNKTLQHDEIRISSIITINLLSSRIKVFVSW